MTLDEPSINGKSARPSPSSSALFKQKMILNGWIKNCKIRRRFLLTLFDHKHGLGLLIEAPGPEVNM